MNLGPCLRVFLPMRPTLDKQSMFSPTVLQVLSFSPISCSFGDGPSSWKWVHHLGNFIFRIFQSLFFPSPPLFQILLFSLLCLRAVLLTMLSSSSPSLSLRASEISSRCRLATPQPLRAEPVAWSSHLSCWVTVLCPGAGPGEYF